jgi:Amidase
VALSRGDRTGPFHGVPICVKESFGVKGQPDTYGIVALRNAKAPANSIAVQRLLDAGAVVVGGTNVPMNLNDWQTFNDIYGTTNNPWDLTRTPGGSSGGSAPSCWAATLPKPKRKSMKLGGYCWPAADPLRQRDLFRRWIAWLSLLSVCPTAAFAAARHPSATH